MNEITQGEGLQAEQAGNTSNVNIAKVKPNQPISASNYNKIVDAITKISNNKPTTKQVIRKRIGGTGKEGKCDDPIFTGYNEICTNPLQADTWERGDPNLTNPDNPATTAPVLGFELEIVTRICYDSTTGELKKIFRDFTFDDQGALKEMGVEQEVTVFSTATCV
jgi:hypothetical protein